MPRAHRHGKRVRRRDRTGTREEAQGRERRQRGFGGRGKGVTCNGVLGVGGRLTCNGVLGSAGRGKGVTRVPRECRPSSWRSWVRGRPKNKENLKCTNDFPMEFPLYFQCADKKYIPENRYPAPTVHTCTQRQIFDTDCIQTWDTYIVIHIIPIRLYTQHHYIFRSHFGSSPLWLRIVSIASNLSKMRSAG